MDKGAHDDDDANEEGDGGGDPVAKRFQFQSNYIDSLVQLELRLLIQNFFKNIEK